MNAGQLAARVIADVQAGKATSRLDQLLRAASVDQLRALLTALDTDADTETARLLTEIAEAAPHD